MKHIICAFLVLFAFFGTNAVLAAGDAAAGERKAASCAACHGADGHAAVPVYPSLAGPKRRLPSFIPCSHTKTNSVMAVCQPLWKCKLQAYLSRILQI